MKWFVASLLLLCLVLLVLWLRASMASEQCWQVRVYSKPAKEHLVGDAALCGERLHLILPESQSK